MFKLMGKIFASGCVYIILIYIHLTCCIVPKSYLDILLSPHIFKGYDLIVSINNDTEGTTGNMSLIKFSKRTGARLRM